MSSLISVLTEQNSIAFTGRISIYFKSSNEYLGFLLLKDAVIIQAVSQKLRDKVAVLNIIKNETIDSVEYIYEVSPEQVESFNKRMYLDLNDLKKEAELEVGNILKIRRLKPPINLKLQVNKKLMLNDIQITHEEYKLLTLVSTHPIIGNLYDNSIYEEDLTTKLLISLKNKNAILVTRSS